LSGLSQTNAVRQFIAIVVGESSDNKDEAAAIGSVLMNRLSAKGGTVIDGFVKKIDRGHPKKEYKAIGKKDYKYVMNHSWDVILKPKKYALRIEGALLALSGTDYSKGAYFWNQTSDKTGSNWDAYNKGIFVITCALGASTFFKYKDPNKKWP
jgi:hypothetical protein